MSDFKIVMGRLKEYFGVSSNKKVAEIIGLNYETMKSWGTRGKVVTKTLMEKLEGEPINFNWLFYGNGEPRITDDDRLLDDINKMAMAINNPIDTELVMQVASDDRLRELLELLPYAPDEFIAKILERLREFKELSEI